MKQQRLRVLTGSLGLMAWGGLVPAHALPSYAPTILNHPTPQAYAGFGWSVAGVGDVNGDGIPDVLVGAPGQDVGGNIIQGQAFVFSGVDNQRLHTLNNPTPQKTTGFGWSVAGIGDVNGDRVPDVVVSANGKRIGDSDSYYPGRVFVFSGANGALLRTLNNPTPQGLVTFGGSVAGVGDVNRDGVPDVLVGDPSQGRAFVFNGTNGQQLYTLDNPTSQAFTAFGGSVAGVGDVNGDGVPDLLVGASWQDVGGNYAHGRAFVFSGATGDLLHTLDHPMPQEYAQFGDAVAGIEDVNNDSVPDLLVGASFFDIADDVDQGQVLIFSGADGSLLRTIDDPTAQASTPSFGHSVAGVGDVNGDGVPDVLVGAPLLYAPKFGDYRYQGLAFLMSGADGSLLYTFKDPAPEDDTGFGMSVASVGDVNSDGRPDFLIGAPSYAEDFNGEPGQAFLFVSGPPPAPRRVALNILPKRINLQTQGVLPVAILTTPRFDATQVDPINVRLGPDKVREIHYQGHQRDVDGDGDRDLVLHFGAYAVGPACGNKTVKLTGWTVTGQPIRGVDRVTVVGCQ